ncbi:phospholipase [Microbacterium sp. SLBN-146]|uniref:aggregation-promoting factor C-terminal-like domain-containing protein n=1 Tax=Microbacterium sp. SLBN-146 TaxID=2768457 RepID=UPI00114EC6D1|nr:phospholipase [Microbacterium sp. SLBN-146]TQJ31280.1 hypothetical protein FBY39_1744 [Microbacterium sp. SLBN-146]
MPASARLRSLAIGALCAGLALGAITVGGLTRTGPVSAAAAASVVPTYGAVPVASGPAPSSLRGPLDAVVDDADAALVEARAAQRDVSAVTGAVARSGLDLPLDTAIDTTDLEQAISRLENADLTPVLMLPALSAEASDATDAAALRTAVVRTVLDTALLQQAAEDAAVEAQRQAEAAAAAAQAAAEAAARAAAEAQARANTVEGAQAVAQSMAAERYGWGADQFSCLVSLWKKESGWNYQAYNASSGATGIPQALPGSKMATAGADWQTNATTQIAWGLDYIDRAYGTPCAAWGHSQATNWY